MASAWMSIELPVADRIPTVACCYAAFIDGQLKYIGSTMDLRNRFLGHKVRYGYARNIITPWGVVSDETPVVIKYRPSRRYGDWSMVELRLIRKLQPEHNKMLKGRKAA